MIKIIYFLIPILLCSVSVKWDEKPIVETTHGKVAGKAFKSFYKYVDYVAFMGIPFAAPPVKELRFLPPQPIEPWKNVLDATKEKKACAQLNKNVKKKKKLGFFGSEDCLYLDIFTPAIDNAKRAVIVFIYNEYFVSSYNKTKDYRPDFFIDEDVITVTISHRLSAFGFLSLEDKTLWGNSGLKDVVAALEWVNNNIEKFGGDPSRITLMGAQGGATIVDLLIHSKKKNLFKYAILQSGNAWASTFLQENGKEWAVGLAKVFDKKPVTSAEVLKDLNDVSAMDIALKDMHAIPANYFVQSQKGISSFTPVVEKDPEGLIVDYPENSSEIDTPIMMGFNSREGLESSLHLLVEPNFIEDLSKKFPFVFPLRVNFSFNPTQVPMEDAFNEIDKYYFKRGLNVKTISDYVTYIGDVFTSYSINYAARFYAKISKSPLYYYNFDYYSDLNENKNDMMKMTKVDEGMWGAAKGDELCYLFRCPNLKEHYFRHDSQMTPQRIFQRKLIKMWTNFAKYGNPTPDGDTDLEGLNWPPYTLEDKQYLDIGKRIQVMEDLNSGRFKFWDDFLERWGGKAEDGVITGPEIKEDSEEEEFDDEEDEEEVEELKAEPEQGELVEEIKKEKIVQEIKKEEF